MPTSLTWNSRWPKLRWILPDLLAFGLGLAIAWKLHWQTTDLVWSLWLGSLVLGYLTILSTIAGGVYIGIRVITHADFPRKYLLPAILIGSALAAFFLAFFSLHFCGFHAGHATFLAGFFPLKGLPDHRFLDAFMNPILLWKMTFQYVVPSYGLFLIPAIIAERKYVFASFLRSVREVREGMHQEKVQAPMQALRGPEGNRGDPFYRPYLNVIRMHLLIFFFAFCHFLKVESFLVYTVVYFVYFFPWKAFAKAPSPGGVVPA
jgi:hypothetical protein